MMMRNLPLQRRQMDRNSRARKVELSGGPYVADLRYQNVEIESGNNQYLQMQTQYRHWKLQKSYQHHQMEVSIIGRHYRMRSWR